MLLIFSHKIKTFYTTSILNNLKNLINHIQANYDLL